jgi:tyrosine-protein phosphatase SIW14
MLLLVLSAGAWAQQATPSKHPAPGTSIVHFSKIDEGVYGGSKPKSDADFTFLQSTGVRYILEVHFLPFLNGPERRKAKRHGIKMVSVPMNASPVPPREKHVNQALEIMQGKDHQPVYLHCVLGRDRTGLLLGLYRIYFNGLTKEKAAAEMKASGFRKSWFVAGLNRYFIKHTAIPAEFASASHK